jgi:hypothetical protein
MPSIPTVGAGPSAAYSDPYADYLVYDTFTDTNGTLLNAHTPDKDTEGGGWIHQSGEWEIQSDAAIPKTLVSSRAVTTIDAGDATVEVQSDLVLGATHNAGFIFRFSDTQNYLEVPDVISADNTIRSYRLQANGWTKIATVTDGQSGTIELNVTVDADSLYTVTIDGGLIYTVTDAFNNTQTKHGMRPYGSLLTSHDYYWVKP